MRNYQCLLCVASVAVLLRGVAMAQAAPSQPSTTQPPTMSPKQASSTPKSAPPSTLEEVLATSPFHFPPAVVEWMRKTDEGANLSQKGDLEARQGDWPDAVKDYQQALTLSPNDPAALYGLGDDSLQRGDVAVAVPYYRHAIYNHPDTGTLTPPVFQPPIISENNAFRVMEYARLLSLIGQQEEALTVYRHGAQMLNNMNGGARMRMRLPDFGDGPGQIAFTPQRLQTLAQVGWAEDHSDFDVAGAGARLQQAVTLFPDSPVPYFYRARYEARHQRDFKAVKADFDKAAQLGDGVSTDAVEQARHFFRDFLPATTQVSGQPKANP